MDHQSSLTIPPRPGLWARLLKHPILVLLGVCALVLFGLVSLATLPIRPSPPIPANRIKISTHYPGAAASVVNRFVTVPTEASVAAVGGIAYVTGSSRQGVSHIRAFLAPGADPNTTYAEVLSAVNAARNDIPAAVRLPNVALIGRSNGNQELNVNARIAPGISRTEVIRFLQTDVIPRLETVPNIGPVHLFAPSPAIRVAMNPARLVALGVTAQDILRLAQPRCPRRRRQPAQSRLDHHHPRQPGSRLARTLSRHPDHHARGRHHPALRAGHGFTRPAQP